MKVDLQKWKEPINEEEFALFFDELRTHCKEKLKEL